MIQRAVGRVFGFHGHKVKPFCLSRVGDIQSELGIPGSTLSHHLEKLKNVDLVTVRRERQFLWYAANAEALVPRLRS